MVGNDGKWACYPFGDLVREISDILLYNTKSSWFKINPHGIIYLS
jgi:hypothetical protein